MMELSEFLVLPTSEIASLVKEAGPQVCVFPINGTRRWFAMEHSDQRNDYITIVARQYIRLFRILFEHGIETILSPIFGGELLHRSKEYVEEALIGAQFLDSAEFYQFYEELEIRVSFYGDFKSALTGTPYTNLIGVADRIKERTKLHQQRRLFFGLFGNDATEAVAKHCIEYSKENGNIPNKRDLIASYYGEFIEPASFFIGFDKPSVFDYPLLSSGEEDLYFTVAPSPYLDEATIRLILYDHIISRKVKEPDWFSMSSADISQLRKYYRDHSRLVLGVGGLEKKVWLPCLNLRHNE